MKDYEEKSIDEILDLYGGKSIEELLELVKQRDKHALYEMVWRREELLPGLDKLDQLAWQNFWYEQAADRGNVVAKSKLARIMYENSCEGALTHYRIMAIKYYQDISNAYDEGTLSVDERESGYGAAAKLWLGILLCKGVKDILRDEKKGIELIKKAEELSNNFQKFGFVPLYALGEMYAQGYAQPDEDPTSHDVNKAIKYLEVAIKRAEAQKTDPKEIEITKEYLEHQYKYLKTKEDIEKSEKKCYDDFEQDAKKKAAGLFNLFDEVNETYQLVLKNKSITNRNYADERRKKMMELSDSAKQWFRTYEDAMKRMQELVAQKEWLSA